MCLDCEWKDWKKSEGLTEISDTDLSTTKRAFYRGAAATMELTNEFEECNTAEEFTEQCDELYQQAMAGAQSLVPDPMSDTRH